MVEAPKAVFRIKSLRLIIKLEAPFYVISFPTCELNEIMQKAEIRNQKPVASPVKVETRRQKALLSDF
jgi:hypothetical protein